MAFRDDRDALRAKASSLEQELSDLRQKLADATKELDGRAEKRRAVEAPSLLAGTRSGLARFGRSLRGANAIWAAAALIVAGGVAGYVFMRIEEPSPREVLFEAQGHVMDFQGDAGVDTSDTCEVEIQSRGGPTYNCGVNVTCGGRALYHGSTHCVVVEGEAVSAHDSAYGSDNDPILIFDRETSLLALEDANWSIIVSFGPRPESVTGTATWVGVVERSVGADVAVESECTLSARMASDGYRPREVDLSIRCGATELYRSSSTERAVEWSLSEGPASAPGTYEYALLYEDSSGEPTRTHASVDTMQRRARIWRDGAPSMFVELRVDDVSGPREAEPIVRTNRAQRARFRETVDVLARVSAADPSAPVAVDEICNFRLRPTWSSEDHDCRLSVRCGRRFLYGGGAGGFTSCTVIEGIPVTATSEGDAAPALRYQRDSGTVALRSFDAIQPWIVQLQLEPAHVVE